LTSNINALSNYAIINGSGDLIVYTNNNNSLYLWVLSNNSWSYNLTLTITGFHILNSLAISDNSDIIITYDSTTQSIYMTRYTTSWSQLIQIINQEIPNIIYPVSLFIDNNYNIFIGGSNLQFFYKSNYLNSDIWEYPIQSYYTNNKSYSLSINNNYEIVVADGNNVIVYNISKFYDKTNQININATLSGILENDNVYWVNNTIFSDINVNKNISIISNSSISGLLAYNYTLIQPTWFIGNIYPKYLSINFIGLSKIYNSLTNGCLLYTSDAADDHLAV
jgi:hypothetical protein